MQLDVSWITDGSLELANEMMKEKKEGGEGRKRKGSPGGAEKKKKKRDTRPGERVSLIDGPSCAEGEQQTY